MRDCKTTGRWLLLLVAAALMTACGRIDPQAELAAAQSSFAARDYRTASIRLSNVIQAEPDNAAAQALRGHIALAMGDPSGAIEDFERASSLGAPLESMATGHAEALLNTGDAPGALAILDQVAESARDAAHWTARGMALTAAGRVADADAAFARSAELGNGETPMNLLGRAQLAGARGNLAQAERLLADAAALAPDDPVVASARGALFMRTNRLPEGAAALQAAADGFAARFQSFREAGVLAALVQVYLANNDTAAAAAAASRLSTLIPNAAIADYAEGLVAYQQGRYADATTLLQRAVSSQPDNPRFLSLLGATQLAVGNLGQAEQQLLRVLRVTPDDPAAIKLLAETRLRQQRPAAALASLQPLAGQSSDDPQVALLSGLASLQAGNNEQAIAYLRQATLLNPASQEYRLALARAYLAAGQAEAASELLDDAMGAAGAGNLGPDVIRLVALVQAGEVDQARAQAVALVERFPDQAQARTAAAIFYRLIGERAAAVAQLEAAVGVDPAFVPARLLLAEVRANEGRLQDAEQQLRAVLEQDEMQAQALIGLAQLAAARGALGEAETLLLSALESSPPAPTLRAAQIMLARLYLRAGRFDEAEQQLAAAAGAEPGNTDVRVMQGALALGRGNAAEAVAVLRGALDQRPGDVGISLALAQAQAASGNPAAARTTLNTALATVPESLPLRAALGAVELRLGNGAAALAIAQALQADFPAQTPGYLLAAEVQSAQRRYDRAADSLELAFAQQPAWELALRRSVALRLAGRADEVEAVFRDWVEANPNHVPARIALASVLQGEGRNGAALTQYDRVLGLDADNVVALNNAAWLARETGRGDALDLAERAYNLAPENPAVLDTYGWLLTLADRDEDGIEYLTQAAQLAPQALEILYHVAYAQAQLGRNDAARATLEALLAEEQPFAGRADAEALLESL